jgi:putative transcriptional regulator
MSVQRWCGVPRTTARELNLDVPVRDISNPRRCSLIMEILQGQLLVASPSLSDPNFARTVVLIAVHGGDGALGLILNRELTTTLQAVWSQVGKSYSVRAENVRHGGPVRGTLMALHDRRSHANLVIAPGVYLATELDAMESLAGSTEGSVLFYLGHSGWGPGQLENELNEGSWLLLPARADHIFADLDSGAIWKLAMNEAGRRELHAVVALKHVPEDPRFN